MKRFLVILCAIVGIVIVGLGIHWAVWELVPPVAGKDLVNYGTFVTVDGMQIHMEHEGTGTPVILIHGYTSTLYTWRFNTPELSKYFSVWSVDLPGFGYSDKPRDFSYTSAGYADFLRDFMDAEGITKAVLVGNSMGGGIAMTTYFTYPERVEKLVLIDSDGYPEEGGGFFLFDLMGLPVLGDVLMSFNYRWLIRDSLMSGVYYDNKFVTDDVIDSYFNVYKTENGRKGPLWVGKGIYGKERFDPERIKTIAVPTLVIWGKEDTLIPVTDADRFGQDIKGAHVAIIPGAGHLPHEEKAEIVNKLITDFVGGTAN
jgi:pimeloyl-ACP methyl ester carboxylesterase